MSSLRFCDAQAAANAVVMPDDSTTTCITNAHDAEPHVRPPLPKAWRTDSETTRTEGTK